MVRKAAIVALVLLASVSITAAGERSLRIIAPADGESVGWQPLVEGTVKDPGTKIWVVVHPTETREYWVQPPVDVEEDGTWSVQIYIGRSGNVDRGKVFRIRAVACPCSEKLHEGKVLAGFPRGKWNSQTIKVKRQ
jgi:hypothetical protein